MKKTRSIHSVTHTHTLSPHRYCTVVNRLSTSSPFPSSLPYPSSFTVVLYAVFAAYFAGVMVRLMLTLTPIVCVLASIVFSQSFDNFLTDGEPEGIPLTSTQEQAVEDAPQASSGTKKGKKGKKKTDDKVRD